MLKPLVISLLSIWKVVLKFELNYPPLPLVCQHKNEKKNKSVSFQVSIHFASSRCVNYPPFYAIKLLKQKCTLSTHFFFDKTFNTFKNVFLKRFVSKLPIQVLKMETYIWEILYATLIHIVIYKIYISLAFRYWFEFGIRWKLSKKILI